jgi:hypothetical protein
MFGRTPEKGRKEGEEKQADERVTLVVLSKDEEDADAGEGEN